MYWRGQVASAAGCQDVGGERRRSHHFGWCERGFVLGGNVVLREVVWLERLAYSRRSL